jgi:hypothetical protein
LLDPTLKTLRVTEFASSRRPSGVFITSPR